MDDGRYGTGKKDILTIGLVIEEVFSEYSTEIVHSIYHAMDGRDSMRLVVIPGRQDDYNDPRDRKQQYKIVYNSIYKIAENCSFDGLIIAMPNLKGHEYKYYKDIPKVFIASDREDEITVNYDDEIGLRQAMDYIIKEKKATEICMLGGRDDNADACKRKDIFIKCLRERMLDYTDYQYERTDMTRYCQNEAGRLLDRNPDADAIFCVNDQVAIGLYAEMKKRNLIPGKDILVFGYDNSDTTTTLIPPLASIGADSASLGQSALEQLLKKIDGRKPISMKLPTYLFARESLDYEMNRYTAKEISVVDNDLISRLFNDCFYRYRNEIKDSRSVDLKILYFDFMSRLLANNKAKSMSDKEYDELCRRIDMFFDNNCMRYTDTSRFVNCIDHLQKAVNENSRQGSKNDRRNELFTRIRNKALLSNQARATADAMFREETSHQLQDYLLETVPYRAIDVDNMDDVYLNLHMLGLHNAALYMYEKPVIYKDRDDFRFPDNILLKCVVISDETKIIPPREQICPIEEIHTRKELTWADTGMIIFPVALGVHVFGILACELKRGILSKGEYLANQLGRVIALRI